LLTFRPACPLARRGVSVHISFAFSRTMLQCRSNALTRARSFLLFRHEMRTWVRERTAVWRMERGPVVSSCSSTCATSYSLWIGVLVKTLHRRRGGDTYVKSARGLLKSSLLIISGCDLEYRGPLLTATLRPPSCTKLMLLFEILVWRDRKGIAPS
jgi:hypothetical protein